MMIRIEMGPGFDAVVADLSATGRRIVAAASRGLTKGAAIAAGNVVKNYLAGQALKMRTGQLAKYVGSWSPSALEAVVGVADKTPVDKYKWLLGDESKTIRPKSAKFLAIPIGENLTNAGVARFESPRDVEGGFFVRTKGRLLFGYKKGKTSRAKFRPLFTLVKSVFVQGSGALYDGVSESVDEVTASMQAEIDKEVS